MRKLIQILLSSLQGETALVCQSRAVQSALANNASNESVQSTCLITGETAEIDVYILRLKGYGAHKPQARILFLSIWLPLRPTEKSKF